MKDAIDSAEEFFDLPSDDKMCFASADVHKHDDIKEGSQVMAVNCYPSCPEPALALGMPSHTDYGTLTILNQSQQGLEIMDHDKIWHPVPSHRAILNVQRKRFSIASLHSMQLEKKVGPAPELVDEQHPAAKLFDRPMITLLDRSHRRCNHILSDCLSGREVPSTAGTAV